MLCENCETIVPVENYSLHILHCRRHIYKCKDCGARVNVKDRERHEQEKHTLIACECGKKIPSYLLGKHQKEDCVLTCKNCGEQVWRGIYDAHIKEECKNRKVTCQYCEMPVPAGELEKHAESCSSRTERCPNCGKFITLRDLQMHVETNCEYPVPDDASWNGNGEGDSDVDDFPIPTLDEDESLYVCHICHRDLGNFEALKTHMANDCEEDIY